MAQGRFLKYAIDPNVRLTGKERGREILEMAICLEENAIILFDALRDMVPPELGQDKIEYLIEEEREHRAVLQDQLVGFRAWESARQNRKILSRIGKWLSPGVERV